MQRDPHSPVAGVREILHDYTTAIATSPRRNPARSWGPGCSVQDHREPQSRAYGFSTSSAFMLLQYSQAVLANHKLVGEGEEPKLRLRLQDGLSRPRH